MQRASSMARLRPREVVKFSIVAALFAIFLDAALGHGLAWENDPYWSYWVTDTFLIATVFGLGTAWLGIGPGRGAVITAVQTLVLTVYYWSFSPIGLPDSPQWLDFEHTWLTGLPIHFAVYYLGYLTVLWLWGRRGRAAAEAASPGRDALVAVAAAIAILALAGGGSALALGEFPGATWFVMRLALTVPILLAWWSLAGRGWEGALSGAVVLSLAWAAYAEFAGPRGLPDTPLRLFDEASPAASVDWLTYRELWLVSLPIYAVAMGAVLLAATRLLRPAATGAAGVRSSTRAPILVSVALTLVLVAPLVAALPATDDASGRATIEAAGPAQAATSAGDGGALSPASGTLSMRVEDVRRRVTPHPPHDEVALAASVAHPDGRVYDVAATAPLVSEPLGRHTTWRGVGIDVWQHGRSGIGTDRLPGLRADVALFAVGSVRSGGRTLAGDVPVQVVSAREGLPGAVELHVGHPAGPVAGLPDGHLRVVWPTAVQRIESGAVGVHYAIGGIVLTGLLALALVACRVGPGGEAMTRTAGDDPGRSG